VEAAKSQGTHSAAMVGRPPTRDGGLMMGALRARQRLDSSEPLASTGSAQPDSQWALRRQHARREHNLWQQKRPAEPERVANKLPDSTQDAADHEQEGVGSHEREEITGNQR